MGKKEEGEVEIAHARTDGVLSMLELGGPMGASEISAKLRVSMGAVDELLSELESQQRIAMTPDGLWGTPTQVSVALDDRRILRKAAPVRYCSASTGQDFNQQWAPIRQGGMDAFEIRSVGF